MNDNLNAPAGSVEPSTPDGDEHLTVEVPLDVRAGAQSHCASRDPVALPFPPDI